MNACDHRRSAIVVSLILALIKVLSISLYGCTPKKKMAYIYRMCIYYIYLTLLYRNMRNILVDHWMGLTVQLPTHWPSQ